MYGVRNLAELLFEEPERIRVGEHQADDRVIQFGLQFDQVDVSVGI